MVPQNLKLDFPTLSFRQEKKLDIQFFTSLYSASINLIKSSYLAFYIYDALRSCETKFPPTIFCYIGAGDERIDIAWTWQKCPNFPKFTGKDICCSYCAVLFFDNLEGLRPAKLSKKRLQHRCFPENFATFLRTPILKNICERLFLTWWDLKYTFNKRTKFACQTIFIWKNFLIWCFRSIFNAYLN